MFGVSVGVSVWEGFVVIQDLRGRIVGSGRLTVPLQHVPDPQDELPLGIFRVVLSEPVPVCCPVALHRIYSVFDFGRGWFCFTTDEVGPRLSRVTGLSFHVA